MQTLIEQLHTDHVNFARLLYLLDQQLALLRDDDTPDFLLMRDIVDYFASYSDLFHHPGEDVLFAAYDQRREDLREVIASLRREHATLNQETRTLLDTLDDIEGGIVSKLDLERQLGGYLMQQTRHMDVEETQVYPLLERVFSHSELEAIEQDLPKFQDPVFGNETQLKYQALYERILNEA